MKRGRPPKPEQERKSKDLRIPVSDEQKALVAEAMRVTKQEMAAWARPILLSAAEAILAAAKSKRRKPPGSV
jgi:hypothetical protein